MTLLKSMAACTREAKTEGEHKMAHMDSTIRQLQFTLSTLTTDLTDACAFGKQDRDRLVEVSQENLRLQKVNSICSRTCAELRMQRSSTELQLLSLKAEVDHKTNNTNTASAQVDPVQTVIHPQGEILQHELAWTRLPAVVYAMVTTAASRICQGRLGEP